MLKSCPIRVTDGSHPVEWNSLFRKRSSALAYPAVNSDKRNYPSQDLSNATRFWVYFPGRSRVATTMVSLARQQILGLLPIYHARVTAQFGREDLRCLAPNR